MIEFEICFAHSSWVEQFVDFDEANQRWNVLIDNGAIVYTTTNFNPEIVI